MCSETCASSSKPPAKRTQQPKATPTGALPDSRHLGRNGGKNRPRGQRRHDCRGLRRKLNIGNIRTSGQTEANLVLLIQREIVLSEPLADLPRGTAHNGILIGGVQRVAFEDIHADGAFFQPIQLLIERALDDMAQEARAFSAGVKLRARKHALQTVQYLLPRNANQIRNYSVPCYQARHSLIELVSRSESGFDRPNPQPPVIGKPAVRPM